MEEVAETAKPFPAVEIASTGQDLNNDAAPVKAQTKASVTTGDPTPCKSRISIQVA